MRNIMNEFTTNKHLRILFTLAYFLLFAYSHSMGQSEKIVYLIPGQGADERLFQNLHIQEHDTSILHFIDPLKGEKLPDYARRMAAQIDTSKRFSIVGVSLGGMVAVEMSKFLQPEEVIIIASAKGEEEIPDLYHFFRKVPIYRILSGRFFKWGTRLMQPFYEPMDKESQQLFRSMVKRKSPVFMKRAVRCIVEWENTEAPDNVYHIHGSKDHTLPIKFCRPDVTIDGGSHMMTLLRGAEISDLINARIKENG